MPSESAVSVPREVSPLNSSTVLPASAVPSIVGVKSLVSVVVVVIDGWIGTVVSTSIAGGALNTDSIGAKLASYFSSAASPNFSFTYDAGTDIMSVSGPSGKQFLFHQMLHLNVNGETKLINGLTSHLFLLKKLVKV